MLKEIKTTKRGKLALKLNRDEFMQLIEVFQIMNCDKVDNPFKSDAAYLNALSFRLVRDFYLRTFPNFLHASETNAIQMSEAEGMAIFKVFNNNTEVHSGYPAVSRMLSLLHQKLI